MGPVISESWSRVSRAACAHNEMHDTFLQIGCVFVILIVVNYIFALSRYHRAHTVDRQARRQLPPQYPFLIPHLGPLFQLWWDHGGFLRRVSSYAGSLTSNRISFLGHTFFNLQDKETIERIFKQSQLSSSIDMYGFVNSHLLGTNKKTMDIYRADDSGPFHQPHPKSNVLHHNRIDYITHNSDFRGLTGPGLQPTMNRFTKDFLRRLDDLDIAEDWTEMSDFSQFFKDIVGLSTLHSLLGPTMFRVNPTFATDIFTFDKLFPTFAPGLPRFMMPKAHQLRDNLVGQFIKWYEYARKQFDSSMIEADGDGDPVWGSAMMRLRQDAILKIDGFDDEALARVDLGLAWATIGNVVPSSMFAAFHIFNDKDVLDRVRYDIQHYVGQGSVRDVDQHHFSKNMPLLSSLYAETLRLYIKVYSVYSSPHADVDLGKWVLPKGALAVLNSEPSHMDANFWNTKGGEHPVNSFWADRFLINPSDPDSGPINPACRRPSTTAENDTAKELHFSTEGCEGAWIPYGGGHSMCPGRFLARNVIIFSSALLASEYEIELSSDPIEFSKKRYGFGVEDMTNVIPFRIRKRKAGNEHATKKLDNERLR